MAAFIFVIFNALFLACPVLAADFALTTAGAPVAPVNAEQAKADPFVAMSKAQRHEIVREFKALLSMGQQAASPSQWVGRDMADCQDHGSPQDTFCHKCEVQMGDTRANYIFYSAGSACRLRDVEVIVDKSDSGLLKDLKPVANQYVGSRAGQFYVEENEASGQSLLCFVWKRPR